MNIVLIQQLDNQDNEISYVWTNDDRHVFLITHLYM